MEIAAYLLFQETDLATDGRLTAALNKGGLASLTVCPVCRVDDFTHIENCPLIPKVPENG